MIQEVTGNVTFIGGSRERDIERICSLYDRHNAGTVAYLKPFYEAWLGRNYSKVNTGWLDWAIAGQVPAQRNGKKAPEASDKLAENPAMKDPGVRERVNYLRLKGQNSPMARKRAKNSRRKDGRMQTISLPNSTQVQIPPDLAADMQSAKFKKLPVFFKQLSTVPGGCTNCGGDGHLWMQFAKAGPFREPNGGKSIFFFCQWILVGGGIEILYLPGLRIEPDTDQFPVRSQRTRAGRAGVAAGVRRRDGRERCGAGLRARFVAACPRPTGWYAVYGPYGVGKSGVLRSIVAACCRALVSACDVRAEDILREMRATFDDSNIGEDELLQKYGHYQVLAIDEVDRVSDTRGSRSALFSLLDMRYNRRNQLATLLATNCNPEKMPAGFEYLQSRMLESQRVEMSGKDLRDSSERKSGSYFRFGILDLGKKENAMDEKPYKMVLYIYNLPADRRDEYMQHVADLTEDFGATCTGVIKLDD